MKSYHDPSCKLCPLHAQVQSVCIPGRGVDKEPSFLFVGEAPGEQEDLKGTPFVGPAGSLLVQAIQEYNLKPARLTNVVRCRPPGNREPTPGEIEACKPYLMAEIGSVGPKIIVACGNVALRALTGRTGIIKNSGRVVGAIGGTPVFAIYHPSYVLRYPFRGHQWEMQLRTLGKLSEGAPKSDGIKVRILSMHDAMKKIEASKEHFVTFDFETSGKYKSEGGFLRCYGFHTGGETFVAEADVSSSDAHHLARFCSFDIKKCAHNLTFESRWLLDEVGLEPKNIVYDTMLFHYLLDENKPHDLESVAMEFCDIMPWKIESEMIEKGQTWENIPFETLAQYCGRDAYYTHQVMRKIIDKFKSGGEDMKKLLAYYKTVLLPTARLCARMAHRGLKIDKDRCISLDSKYEKENGLVEKEIQGIRQVKEFLAEKGNGFKLNLGSPDHVRELAVKKLKLPLTMRTGKGKPSVSYDSLYPFRKKSRFAGLYLDWKERNTLRNNYLRKLPRFICQDGLIHPNHNPSFQVTTRVSVTNPPLSNHPRDPEIRGVVTSRFPGGNILSLDYKQLEMRLLASEAGEAKMLRIFEDGGDIHDATAREMFGDGFTKEQRALSKNINFGTVYGIEEWSFSRKFYVPVDDAKEWLGRHREIYPEIYRWMDEQHKFIKHHGWIEGRFGSRRRLPGVIGAEGKELLAFFRQAGNYPIQNQGAVITNLAGVRFDEETDKMWEFNSVLYHIHHDSLNIDCYPGEEEKVEGIARRVMEKEIPAMCRWLKVSLPVDSVVGNRWGDENGK